MSLPLGYQINNPGDLRDQGIAWRGMVGASHGFCHFATPAWGIRALMCDLHNKWAKDGLRTVEAIVEKFAPPEDDNPTDAYITHVSTHLGVASDEALDLESNDKAQLKELTRAMIRQELSGSGDAPEGLPADWYSDAVYIEAYHLFCNPLAEQPASLV